MRLRGCYSLKSPKIRIEGRNTIVFGGSQAVAAMFFRGILAEEVPAAENKDDLTPPCNKDIGWDFIKESI